MKSKQKGLSKVLVIVIIAVLIAIAGGATSWFLLSSNNNSNAGAAVAQEAKTPPSEPIFYKLEPFTVNLTNDQQGMGGRLLYIGVTLMLENEQSVQLIDKYLPQIRGNLLMALSDQDAATLISRDGKQALAKLIKQTVEQKITDSQPIILVDDVLFTQFIVQ